MYLLFAGEDYDEQLPSAAFRGRFLTRIGAVHAARRGGFDWYELYDTRTKKFGATVWTAEERRRKCKHRETYRVHPQKGDSQDQGTVLPGIGHVIASGMYDFREPGLYCPDCDKRLGD